MVAGNLLRVETDRQTGACRSSEKLLAPRLRLSAPIDQLGAPVSPSRFLRAQLIFRWDRSSTFSGPQEFGSKEKAPLGDLFLMLLVMFC